MTSPRRTGKKSKARDHHLEEQATVPKKSRANQLPEPCHSSRAGAGSGGKGSQLEKIGAALEVPTQLPKTTTTLPNGSLTNLLAPVPAKKGCKKKSPAHIRKVTRGLIHLKSSEPDGPDSSDGLDIWSWIAGVSPPV
ncbi:hypothetical protein SCLCIDRAFT_30623 [Scleroderma citrinum Foug A]|uniref:Uncharacterized protein n=1 Tax=Scleroderma citrinum Foug A TaxID=1036808 RepID=A0A0C2YZY8_9AGAM|nr:hypothetical protein SCLCIDRAFT_30623 [Scleroderma citrinum Foug A]